MQNIAHFRAPMILCSGKIGEHTWELVGPKSSTKVDIFVVNRWVVITTIPELNPELMGKRRGLLWGGSNVILKKHHGLCILETFVLKPRKRPPWALGHWGGGGGIGGGSPLPSRTTRSAFCSAGFSRAETNFSQRCVLRLHGAMECKVRGSYRTGKSFPLRYLEGGTSLSSRSTHGPWHETFSTTNSTWILTTRKNKKHKPPPNKFRRWGGLWVVASGVRSTTFASKLQAPIRFFSEFRWEPPRALSVPEASTAEKFMHAVTPWYKKKIVEPNMFPARIVRAEHLEEQYGSDSGPNKVADAKVAQWRWWSLHGHISATGFSMSLVLPIITRRNVAFRGPCLSIAFCFAIATTVSVTEPPKLATSRSLLASLFQDEKIMRTRMRASHCAGEARQTPFYHGIVFAAIVLPSGITTSIGAFPLCNLTSFDWKLYFTYL